MAEPHEVTPAEFLAKAAKVFKDVRAFEIAAVVLLVNGEIQVVSAPLNPTEFLVWLESRMLKPKENSDGN